MRHVRIAARLSRVFLASTMVMAGVAIVLTDSPVAAASAPPINTTMGTSAPMNIGAFNEDVAIRSGTPFIHESSGDLVTFGTSTMFLPRLDDVLAGRVPQASPDVFKPDLSNLDLTSPATTSSGNCGSSWIYATDGGYEDVQIDTGFEILENLEPFITPAESRNWLVEVVNTNSGFYELPNYSGSMWPPEWLWSIPTDDIWIGAGTVVAAVYLGEAQLSNGVVCFSLDPAATVTIR